MCPKWPKKKNWTPPKVFEIGFCRLHNIITLSRPKISCTKISIWGPFFVQWPKGPKMAWKWKNGTSPTVLEIRFCRFQTLLTKISIWGLVFEQCPKSPKLVWNWQIELLYTIIFELGSSSLGGNIYLPKGQTFKEQIFDLGPGFWAVAQDLLEMAHNKTIELLLQIFELGSSYFWIVLTYPGNKHAFMAWFIIRIQIFGLWPKMCPNGPTLKNSTSLSVFWARILPFSECH